MRKLALWVIVFAAAAGGVLHAQDITGSWQGTLQPPGGGPALRIVMQLSKADQGLKAVMHSIDQGAQPINAATVTLQGSTLKIAVPALGGNYEGRLAADGNSITGTWTQGAPAPLNLARATPATAWAIPEPAPPPAPMAANANLVFEVATIKPANPEVRGQSILVSAQRNVYNHQHDIERPHHFCMGYSRATDRGWTVLARIGTVRYHCETGTDGHTQCDSVENDGSKAAGGALWSRDAHRKKRAVRLRAHRWQDWTEAFEERQWR